MADTTGRALRLLTLLQARPVWTGPELADRLGVTTRSIRRDVERLRELGYPVAASQGVGGGYQLGAGAALPPLLLDDEEAVAVAVCLRLAAAGAGSAVEGMSEAAVRTLAKLDQVMPARLRRQVSAVQESTTLLQGPVSEGQQVDPDTLLVLARACRDRERVDFAYTAASGQQSTRRVEPYRLVATGRRWYLMAFDRDRDDWRTFRLDRIDQARATGFRFHPREAPDPAEFVRRATSVSPYEHVAVVRIAAGRDEVLAALPPSVGTVEAVDGDTCLLRAGGTDPDWMALHLARLPWGYVVEGPPQLREAMARLAGRMRDGLGDPRPAGQLGQPVS